MRARLALIEGRGQDAVAEMRSAIPILDEAGFPLQSRNAWYMAEAAALALSGELDGARACGRRYEEGLRPEGRRIVRIWDAMIDALRAGAEATTRRVPRWKRHCDLHGSCATSPSSAMPMRWPRRSARQPAGSGSKRISSPTS